MHISDYLDFRDYLKARVKAMPRGGRGEFRKLAQAIGIHTTTLSQIIQGSKPISLEHAAGVCEYFGLSSFDTRYFLLLVQYDRAGSEKLRKLLREQLDELKKQSQELARRLPTESQLTFEQNAVFYSNWFYSAIRILSSIEGYQTPEAIAERLKLPRQAVNQALEFLLSTGLCSQEHGRLAPGAKYTHIAANSPLVSRHHGNWRTKAMERHPSLGPQEIAYTAPMSISKKDAQELRKRIVAFIEEFQKTRAASDPEVAFCLAIDFFEF
jgi:uncharacterized protein (TIGR02147 family)